MSIDKGMSKTDPSILDMRLVRNGIREWVSAMVIGLMGVDKGHLIWSAQQGVMRTNTANCMMCDQGSKRTLA